MLLLLLRVLVALLRVGRVLFAAASAAAVSHGTRRVHVRNSSEGEVLELLQEILATLGGGIHHLLQSELDLQVT